MGKRGPLPKRNDKERQGHSKAKLQIVTDLPQPIRPDPPDSLGPVTTQMWDEFWDSDVARATKDTDINVIRRLWRLYERFEVAMGLAEKYMAVRGSTGQVKVSPFMDLAIKLNSEMLRTESELGLTPVSRARLGLGESKDEGLAKELRKIIQG